MLLATAARVHGPEVLRDLIIDPMLAGRPPFVLSDACPGDLMPMPIWLRLADWPNDADHKRIKRARWLTPGDFQRTRRGELPAHDALVEDAAVLCQHTRQHNTLDRLTDTTGDAESGQGTFNLPETLLHTTNTHLSVHFRVLEAGFEDILLELFDELALTGFGADTAIGRGHFEFLGNPEPVPELGQPPENANAVISLSTFQPGPNDPVDGLWDAFPKFGKLGPDLGVDDVRKNTLILFRPGACFSLSNASCPSFLGRAVPTGELLSPAAASALRERGFQPIHSAFALCIAAKWPESGL
jgi:hypothetical protein